LNQNHFPVISQAENIHNPADWFGRTRLTSAKKDHILFRLPDKHG
jgi:hypothetical protein